MNNRKKIKMPKEVHEYLWTRYLPETTYKMYIMIGYLQTENIKGEKATRTLLNANLKDENSAFQVIEEKKRILNKLGYKYPTNRKEDLKLLIDFKLIKIGKDKDDNIVYVYNLPVLRPQEVLDIDDEEIKNLENIKFELKHQEDINMFLTLLINNNGNLMSSVSYIIDTINSKITDIRDILRYLADEGSINITSDKNISKLKKSDKVYIKINREIFEEKRFVLED